MLCFDLSMRVYVLEKYNEINNEKEMHHFSK